MEGLSIYIAMSMVEYRSLLSFQSEICPEIADPVGKHVTLDKVDDNRGASNIIKGMNRALQQYPAGFMICFGV